MTDQAESVNQEPVETVEQRAEAPHQESISADDFKSLQAEVEALRRAKNDILNEKKKEQAKRREAEQAAEQEALEAAKKKGKYEELYQAEQKARLGLEEQLQGLQNAMTQKEIMAKAQEMANTVASGYRANDLAEKIANRLQKGDEGFQVTDGDGTLTINTPDQLLQSMVNDERFAHLIDGSKATGGGAKGSSSSANSNKPIPYAEFAKKSPSEQREFIENGGRHELED